MKRAAIIHLVLLALFGPIMAVAQADETEAAKDFMHSNKRYAIASGIGVAASVFEHHTLSNIEASVALSVLQKHHPKLYNEIIAANTNYAKNPYDRAARTRIRAANKALQNAITSTRNGAFLPKTNLFERFTLRNLNRLKVGARIWGIGAFGFLGYLGYDSLCNIMQSDKTVKIQPRSNTPSLAKEKDINHNTAR